MEIASDFTPVTKALSAHSDRLVPGAIGQLAVLWQDELGTMPDSAIEDLVAARLAKPAYQHFVKGAGQTQAPPDPAPAPAINPFPAHGRRGFAMAESQARHEASVKAMAESLRSSAADAPGLAGNYR